MEILPPAKKVSVSDIIRQGHLGSIPNTLATIEKISQSQCRCVTGLFVSCKARQGWLLLGFIPDPSDWSVLCTFTALHK